MSSIYQGIPLSIPELIIARSDCDPGAVAILAPGCPPITYGRLRTQMDHMIHSLRAMGLSPFDRVALVLPNGPELAVTLITVASGATCAPLNPNYSADEYTFHLTNLRVRTLIIQAGMDSPARAIAHAQGIRVVELCSTQDGEANLFSLSEVPLPKQTGTPVYAQPNDIAVVMQTSGTTSRPKIIPRTHTNICTGAFNMRMAVALDSSDRYLNVMPLFHSSAFVLGLLASLTAGASVVCLPHFDASQFFDWLAAFRPTWYMGVTAIHQALLAKAPLHREIIARYPLRFIRAGAAALPDKVQIELERTFKTPVIAAYGMTEASLIACNPLPPLERKLGSVGVRIGQDVAVMNAEGTLLADGESGEIVVRGPSVIKGYENDPTANREAYSDGWFRTGDSGFFDTDGYLFITGRLKEMINRGGAKISPQEVDEVLIEHPSVAQAATFAVPHLRWGEDVVSAVVLYQHARTTAQDLRRFVATRLVQFKVPSRLLIVERIPVGPTGKLQRHLLPERLGLTKSAQGQAGPVISDGIPRTPLEEVVSGLWMKVLDLDRVEIDDNFFQVGGDSILALQLLSRIRDATQVELSFRSFFEAPTIADITRLIADMQSDNMPRSEPPLQPVSHDNPLLLSYSQKRLWFLEQLGISRHAYHLLNAVRLFGLPQVSVLEQSLREIVKRHAILRTTFIEMVGEPRQVILSAIHLTVFVEDLRDVPQNEQKRKIHIRAKDFVLQPFDLTRGPLIRATLLRLTDNEYVLLVAIHHIVSDGWSNGLFWQELATIYAALLDGQHSPLPELPIQYADFAHWQQQWMQCEIAKLQLAYWKRQLAELTTLQLPVDHPYPAVQSFRGARYVMTLSKTLTKALKTLSRRCGVTLFMMLLAAFQTLLYRYTGQDDIVVGSLVANRNRTEIESLIGFFVNTLVLRSNLSGDPSFHDLLARVRDVTLGAYENQDVPYEKLLEELRPPRDLSRNPLFQVMCVLHNTPQQAPELTDLTIHPLDIDPGIARFDLTLEFWETPEGLRSRFEYSTDLFEAATITRMAGHLLTLLEGIVAEPEEHLSRLPLLTTDERQQMLVDWNATTAPYPEACIQSVFETQVERTPEAVAVICGDASYTYRELSTRANQVAHYLLACGVKTETLVGLYVERSLDMVVGLLGILKAGAAYVPLDPDYPPERLAFMLRDAQPEVVLTQERLVEALGDQRTYKVCLDANWSRIAQYPDDKPSIDVTADNLAYLLYTSGSTGGPKGVQGTHRGTLNIMAWLWQTFPFARHEVCCQKTSINFVDALQELLAPLLLGVPTVLVPGSVLKDLPRFVQTLSSKGVTRLILVPSLLRALLDTHRDLEDRLPHLKLWFSGGEALSSELCQRFHDNLPHCRLINLYGASEASANTTWYDITQAPNHHAFVPIGRPIANTQVYVLDSNMQPVPVGVSGELYVGGVGLAQGYLNSPELTAERFIPNTFCQKPGARLYRTGDMVRYQSDGNITFEGRADDQVKLRGVRMALGEIEAALMQHPAVQETVVMVREDKSGEACLVAYVVPVQTPAPTIRELRSFLEKVLPVVMLPMAFVMLDTLPRTPSGKVDRQSLPPPPSLRPELGNRYIAPRNAEEEQIATVWRQLLGLNRIGVHDNFFELGGHSLLAIQLLFQVRDATQVELPLLCFFEAPTVAGMAASLEAVRQHGTPTPMPTIIPISRKDALPASVAQEHFWLFDQVLPGLPVFNLPYSIRLHGALNVAILEKSFDEMIRRHEVLRTTFDMVNGQLVQIVVPMLHISLSYDDLRSLPEAERESEARRLLRAESQRSFDLVRGPLLRSRLLQQGEQEHLLLVVLHHIICDGWSLGKLMRELAILYDAFALGEPSPLPVLSIQYADFAAWQRQWRQHPMMEAQLVYWRTQLHEPLPVLQLPTDHRRDSRLSLRTAAHTVAIPSTLCASLSALSQREGSTLFMTCLAAFKVLLYGYTGQEDLCVATLVANRTLQETESLIGLLANTMILRTNLSGNPTQQEVLRRVRVTMQAAHAHQDLPFEELVRVLESERDITRTSLSQVMLLWQTPMVQTHQFLQRALRFEAVEQRVAVPEAFLTTFDMILRLSERQQGLTATIIYKNDLFDAETVSHMLDDFQYVLTCFSEQPEQKLKTFHALRGERN